MKIDMQEAKKRTIKLSKSNSKKRIYVKNLTATINNKSMIVIKATIFNLFKIFFCFILLFSLFRKNLSFTF